MLLQSPRPDVTMFQGLDFARELDPLERSNSTHGPSRALRKSVAILEEMSETAVARPLVFNRELALERLGGLHELFVDVMRLIQVESPKVHSQIQRSLSERDAVELKRAAHTLKGTASIVGAADLMNRLAHVETLAAAHDFPRVARELPEISRQFDALQECIATELLRQF
ncbi:MAG: Hpt domain-containing protein [Planctomycetales bacterium]|nr:Hpt domain-containing protein [Planctomycetales bacterium]